MQWLGEALARATSREDVVTVMDAGEMLVGGDAARWAVAGAEHLAAVATQPAHAAALAALQRRLDQEVTTLLDQHCRRLGLQPAMPLPELVVAWSALGGGLVLRRAVDPDTDVAAVMAALLRIAFPPAPDPESVTP